MVLESSGLSSSTMITTRQAFWHCMNLVLGLGTLTVPHALKQLGYVGGIITLAFLAMLSSYTSKLLCRCVESSRKDSPEKKLTYSDLGDSAFGNFGRRFVDIILYVDLVASSALFLVLIATNMATIFSHLNISIESWIIIAAISLVPTVLMKLDSLSALSALGSYVMVSLVLAIVSTLFFTTHADLHDNEYKFASFELQAFGNLVFAFAMHGTLLTIYQDMKRPQDAEIMFDRVYLTGFLLKFIVGASGYFLFAQGVSDQITLDLPNPNMRFVITMAITLKNWLTYPLPLEPCARALEDLNYKRVPARVGLVGLTVIVSLSLPRFGLMQSLIGALCAGFLVLLFPLVFYIKIVLLANSSVTSMRELIKLVMSNQEMINVTVLLLVSSLLVLLASLAAFGEAVK